VLANLDTAVVAAPMAGGVSTPALVAAVGAAGALGFLAAGYRDVAAVRAEIEATRALSGRPFGVNLFVPGTPAPLDPAVPDPAVADYRNRLLAEARRYGVEPGAPIWDDDGWAAKLELVALLRVPVVSFTFGCPAPEVIEALQRAGCTVLVTVTTPDEAILAAGRGADALCVQGPEAGGHRATFTNTTPPELGLPALLAGVRAAVPVPLVAAGGLVDGRDVAAVLAAGAIAAQAGTAFLPCPESGAHPVHKAALTDPAYPGTAVTRAFTGRPARGLVNPFLTNHPDAPAAYPQVHHVTRPIRTAAATAGDPQAMALWAGQGHARVSADPAAVVVRRLASGAE
jgi:nitronate monooxygenase